jgi:probable phosphoglycerate mutase
VIILDYFREIKMGAFEQYPGTEQNWHQFTEILGAWESGNAFRRFPQGENFHELCQRLRYGFNFIQMYSPSKNAVIVSHGGVVKYAIWTLCPGNRIGARADRPVQNCSISTVDIVTWTPDIKGILNTWGSIAHLSGEAADLVPGVPVPLSPTEGVAGD